MVNHQTQFGTAFGHDLYMLQMTRVYKKIIRNVMLLQHAQPIKHFGWTSQSSAGSLSTRCLTPLNAAFAVKTSNSVSIAGSVKSTQPTTPAIN